jgi:hypothetical protein
LELKELNPEKYREYLDKACERSKKWRLNNIDKAKKNSKKTSRKWYEQNKEKAKENARNCRLRNPQRRKELDIINIKNIKERKVKWKINNKNKIRDYNKLYRELNTNYRKEYYKNRLASDPLFKLSRNTRSMILNSLRKGRYPKKCKTKNIIGCTFDEFKIHIETQFEHWMNWGNYGKHNGEFNYGWDIDHIIPVSSAKNEDEVIAFNHYTNLRPLCSYVNRHLKRNRIDYEFATI